MCPFSGFLHACLKNMNEHLTKSISLSHIDEVFIKINLWCKQILHHNYFNNTSMQILQQSYMRFSGLSESSHFLNTNNLNWKINIFIVPALFFFQNYVLCKTNTIPVCPL